MPGNWGARACQLTNWHQHPATLQLQPQEYVFLRLPRTCLPRPVSLPGCPPLRFGPRGPGGGVSSRTVIGVSSHTSASGKKTPEKKTHETAVDLFFSTTPGSLKGTGLQWWAHLQFRASCLFLESNTMLETFTFSCQDQLHLMAKHLYVHCIRLSSLNHVRLGRRNYWRTW